MYVIGLSSEPGTASMFVQVKPDLHKGAFSLNAPLSCKQLAEAAYASMLRDGHVQDVGVAK